MWEEVHRKDRLGHFGFLYRFAVGACRNRLADYLFLEHGGAGRVLILKVAEQFTVQGTDCQPWQQR
jgi:protein tyrosine/serine phosphatase